MFESISKLLPKVINRYGLSPAVQGTILLTSCEDFLKTRLSPEILKEIRPLYIKRNILYIEVTSSLIAQEVNALSMDLLNRLNGSQNDIKIKTIRFKTK